MGYHRKGILLFILPKRTRVIQGYVILFLTLMAFLGEVPSSANQYKSIYPTLEIDIEDEFQKLKCYMQTGETNCEIYGAYFLCWAFKETPSRKSW